MADLAFFGTFNQSVSKVSKEHISLCEDSLNYHSTLQDCMMYLSAETLLSACLSLPFLGRWAVGVKAPANTSMQGVSAVP